MQPISIQYNLRPEIPNIYGTLDYRIYRDTLDKIDEILIKTGLENRLVDQALRQMATNSKKTESEFYNSQSFVFHWNNFRYALRCNIAKCLTEESLRKFSIHLADSNILQWFTGISVFGKRKAVSKSTLDRYSKYFDEGSLKQDIQNWLACLSESKNTESFGLENPINCKDIFMDTTCIKANIHFPVDWVLLIDAVRSLLLAIKTIRAQGLKHRMIDPKEFLKMMNKLSIEMTHTRRRKDSKKQRKRIFRAIKKLSRCIEQHAIRYRHILIDRIEETEWTEAQANLVIKRMDNILNQLPAAISQAHERIIREKLLPSKEKLLSLYEPDAHIIVRGKAENEVEFGNGLLIAEQSDGIIVDWELYKDQPPADSKLVNELVTRIENNHGAIHSACSDRGFHSAKNEEILRQHGIYDAMCPRNPQKLKERMQEREFVLLQMRRSQTEARIGIFKNVFLGRPLRRKGFLNKQLSVSWCVLTHNLWVIARMALADEQSDIQKAA